ncbi:glycerate kinase type-2 family protein [Fodinibius halophilus]|uniref:DUF4147 domain-containing protein n=1 Tax=Fodinibius halophilus TaxID=1736908 RepID=A0A6M1SW78_9BACT|nr:DUF4147 domain-containing protein [Fodinibius halophilus]NGP87796.1 DUF4147 domain-containing protein [Fodinibius halophilus]
MDPKVYLKELFLQGLEFCFPGRAVEEAMVLRDGELKIADERYAIRNRPIYLFAVGKAAVPMYKAANKVLGEYINRGFVIYLAHGTIPECSADIVLEASHPTPNSKSWQAGRQAVEFVKGLPENAILITLISGGTSSLMCLPAEGISIDDLTTTFELLNRSGATIGEINTVRKHCSRIKGGQLLKRLDDSVRLINLVVSDVPGDELMNIGSGPTVPDSTTFEEANEVVRGYGLWGDLPPPVQDHILKGIAGEVPETLKQNRASLRRHSSYVISSASRLAHKIGAIAGEEGIQTHIADEAFNADVEEVAKQVAAEVRRYGGAGSKLFVFYGESTVTVQGDGKGGRNQELALRGAMEIEGRQEICWLSAGTDGIDGPTDAAGAIVDGNTVPGAREYGLVPEEYLGDNDSYHFHQQMGTLLKTGPSGNNLMDIVLVLVEGESK